MASDEQMTRPQSPSRGRTSALWMVSASGLAAISNFVVMMFPTRALDDPGQQAEALAFWSLLTGLFGVLVGVQNECTRAAGSVAAGRPARSSLIGPAMVLGSVVGALVGGVIALTARSLLPSQTFSAGFLLVLASVTYALYTVELGVMAGQRRWVALAATLSSEVLLRMLLVGIVAVTTASLLGFEAAMVAAVVMVLALRLLSPAGRDSLRARSDHSTNQTLRNMGYAVVSTSATALMITAYPALMKVALADQQLAAWMVAVSFTRAPLLMPIMTFQQVAISRFLAHRATPVRALLAPMAAVVGLGLVASLGMWALGPWFLRLFNSAFEISGPALALLTLGAVGPACLLLMGTAALALEGHVVYAWGWLGAAAVSIGMLTWAPGGTLSVLLCSLVIGPMVGLVIVGSWIVAQSRRSTDSPR